MTQFENTIWIQFEENYEAGCSYQIPQICLVGILSDLVSSAANQNRIGFTVGCNYLSMLYITCHECVIDSEHPATPLFQAKGRISVRLLELVHLNWLYPGMGDSSESMQREGNSMDLEQLD